MDKFLSNICDEVVDENEEDELLREALATEGEMLGEELAVEHAPNEEITRENDEEQMLQKAEHVLELIAEVYAPILEPPIQEPTHVPEPTAEEAQPSPQNRQQRDTLWYLYEALTPPSFRPCDHLQTFRPTVGRFADDRELGDVNNPQHMDVDAPCFFMLSQDLPLLLGAIIRPDNRKVRIRNFEGFGDWMYVISDHVVVGVYAGDTDLERELTKIKILEAPEN